MKENRFNKRGTDKGSNEKTQTGSGTYQLTKVLKPSACKPETLYRVCIQDTCISRVNTQLNTNISQVRLQEAFR